MRKKIFRTGLIEKETFEPETLEELKKAMQSWAAMGSKPILDRLNEFELNTKASLRAWGLPTEKAALIDEPLKKGTLEYHTRQILYDIGAAKSFLAEDNIVEFGQVMYDLGVAVTESKTFKYVKAVDAGNKTIVGGSKSVSLP